MKAKIEILSTVIILVLLLFSCRKETDSLDCETLEGNKKLKRILEYDSINSILPKRILEQYEYDEFGRISKVSVPKSIDTNLDSSLYSYNLYEYDPAGKLIKIANFNANIYSPGGYVNLANYYYNYSNQGEVIKEYIEYPLIGSFAYSLNFHSAGKLIKTEKYKMDTDELESYIEYDYDKCGRLIKESTVFMADTEFIYFTEHSYQNGLNVKSDVYAGRASSTIEHIQQMVKTYDIANNLIINEINELQEYSSQLSRVIRYEYFTD